MMLKTGLILILILILFGFRANQTTAQQATLVPISSPEATLIQGQSAFEGLLQTNGGCQLPCWWGFRVNETKESDWTKFLDDAPFRVFRVDALDNGTDIPLGDSGYFSFPNSTENSVILSPRFENQVLVELHVQLNSLQDWLSPQIDAISLGRVLAQLGENTEIYIDGNTFLLNLHFLVFNKAKGFVADYYFNLWNLQDQDNYLKTQRYCLDLQYTTRIAITLYDPQAIPSGSENYRLTTLGEDSQYLPISAISNIDTSEFIRFFAQHPDDCLVVSAAHSSQPPS